MVSTLSAMINNSREEQCRHADFHVEFSIRAVYCNNTVCMEAIVYHFAAAKPQGQRYKRNTQIHNYTILYTQTSIYKKIYVNLMCTPDQTIHRVYQ